MESVEPASNAPQIDEVTPLKAYLKIVTNNVVTKDGKTEPEVLTFLVPLNQPTEDSQAWTYDNLKDEIEDAMSAGESGFLKIPVELPEIERTTTMYFRASLIKYVYIHKPLVGEEALSG